LTVAVSGHSTDSGQVVIHAVCLPTTAKLRISHSAKKVNHENSSQWKIAWQISLFLVGQL